MRAKVRQSVLPDPGNEWPGSVSCACSGHRDAGGGGCALDRRSPGPDLVAIASAASREAGGVPVALLGDYLPAAAGAAASGRRLTAAEVAGDGTAGGPGAVSGGGVGGAGGPVLAAARRP